MPYAIIVNVLIIFERRYFQEEMNEEIYKNTMRKFMHISRLHRSVFEKNVSSLGIHHSQHHLLMYISKCDETPSQKEIAEHFKISPAAVAVSLKKLEKGGFIEKISTEDGRVNKILITERGKEIIEKTHKMFAEIDKQVFSQISENELKTINESLDKILINLEEISEE